MKARPRFKMNVIVLLAVLAPIFLTVSTASAYCSAQRCVAKINRIYTTGASDGRVYIQFNDNMQLLNCTLVSGVYVTLYESHKRFEEIYNTLNSALLVGKAINVRINENSDTCSVAYTMLE